MTGERRVGRGVRQRRTPRTALPSRVGIRVQIRRPDLSAADLESEAASPLRDSAGVKPDFAVFAHHDYCRDNVTVAEFLAKKKFREALHAIGKIGISQGK